VKNEAIHREAPKRVAEHAAAAGLRAVLLVGLSVAACAQSVSFAGFQTSLTIMYKGKALNFPYGVAVDGTGDVFIADSDNNRVVEIPAGCATSSCLVLVGVGLNSPHGVAADGAGDVFIADTYNNRVVEVPASGAQTTVGSGLKSPASVAADPAGDVWIADTNNSRVVEVPAGCTSSACQITVNTGIYPPSYPSGVAVDGAGDVFIADTDNSRVVEVPYVDGTYDGSLAATVGTGVSYPVGVAVDGAGNIFIANSIGPTSSWLLKVPAGGGAQTTVGTGLSYPYELAVDSKGDVFIADSSNNRVVEVQPGPVNFGDVNVCLGGQTTPAPCSGSVTLNFNINASITLGSTPSTAVSVLTQGAPNLDFTLGSPTSNTTCTGSQTAGTPCAVAVSFNPLAPGSRMGAVQLMDSSGDLLVTTLVQGVGQGPLITFGPYNGNSIPAPSGGFSNPTGLAVDATGDVFVADTNHSQVVEVPFQNGAYITPIVISIGSLRIGHPGGVVVDGAGNLFIANSDFGQVVEVPYISGSYNGSLATTVNTGSVQLIQPFGVAVDGAGDLFVADGQLTQLVELPAGGGAPIMLGNGLSQPYAVTVDAAGNLYIADSGNSRLVEVQYPSGNQVVLDNTSGNPYGVAVDAGGDAFYTDLNNNGIVELPFGGTPFTLPNIGLQFPTGVALDGGGDYFIANSANNQVFEVLRSQPPPYGFGFANTVVGQVSSDSPQSVIVENAGNGSQPLAGTISGLGGSFIQSNSGMPGACSSNFSLVPGALCHLSISFEPLSAAYFTSSVVFTDDNLNTTTPSAFQTLGLQGTGTLAPQFITFTTNAPASWPDDGSTFTVAATASSGLQVTFSASGSCSNSGPTGATFTMTSSTGTCTVTASQPGNPYYAPATSTEITAATSSAPAVVESPASGTNSGAVNVCPAGQTAPSPCNSTITLTYNIAANVTLASTAATAVSVLTQGAPNQDFTLSSTTCTGSQTAGTSCTVTVTFAPRSPGLRMGAVEIMDPTGNVLVTTPVQGLGEGPAIAFASNAQLTLPAPSPNGYNNPNAVAVDGAGDIFVADTNNNQVVELLAGGSNQTTVGTGLKQPTGVAIDGAGNVYIADSGNNRVVEVPYLGSPGTYGAETMVSSTLNQPFGVAVDGAGDVFITDSGNNQVLEVEFGCCVQTTVATGLNGPYSVAVDGAGDVFIADTVNQQVLKYPFVSAGSYGSPITVANSSKDGLSNVYGVAVDAAGDVFLTDTFNYRVLEIPYINGIYGTPTNVGSGLRYSSGVAVDGAGDIFIADSGNNRVVEEQRSQPPTLSFASTLEFTTSSDSPQSVTIQDIGNQPLSAISPGLVVTGLNFAQVPGSGTPADCSSTFSLATGATCNLSISFMPQTTGLITSQATFTDNALNATAADQNITLQGNGVAAAVTVSINPSSTTLGFGGTEQFSATVTGTTNTAVFWSVLEGSVGGTISGSGLYTASATPGTFHVIATSSASASSFAVAAITVSIAPTITIGVTPPSATVATWSTEQFTATVTGTTDTAVTWSVEEGQSGGMVSSSGLYTAPGTAGIFHVEAISNAFPTASAIAVVTVNADVLGNETININDAVTITPLINVAVPVASFSSSSLGFGSVGAGGTGTQIIMVSNVGEGTTGLDLSNAVISPAGPPFTLGPISCSNGATSLLTTLPSGGACLVTISYVAPVSGPQPSATITFADNAALSNLPSTPAGGSIYTQTILLNGAGTTAPQPPEPPATVPLNVNETVNVIDQVALP
jgi:sugar lactone lactonase YvrE